MKFIRIAGAAALAIVAALSFAPVASAQSLTDYAENKLIDHIFRGISFTAPSVLAVGLFTSACSDSAPGTEVSGGSYARAVLNPSDSNWKSTQGTTSGASSGTGGQTKNAVQIDFPAPTGNWGSVSHFGIFDASSGGNMLICQALSSAKTVNNGDAAPSFAVDALTVTFQ